MTVSQGSAEAMSDTCSPTAASALKYPGLHSDPFHS